MTDKKKVIWFFLKPYKLQIVILFVLASLIGILEATAIATIYPIVDLGLNIEAGAGNMMLQTIVSMAMLLPVEDTFTAYCILVINIAVIVFIVKIINVKYQAWLIANIVRVTKKRLFEKQMKADYQYFLDTKQGGLVYTTSIATGEVATLVNSVAKMMSSMLLMLFLLALLFSMNWKGAMIVVVIGLAYYFLTQYIGTKVSYRTGKRKAEVATNEHIILNEVFNGIKQIKVYLTQSDWVKRFSQLVYEYHLLFRKNMVWSEIPAHSLWLLLFSSIAIMAVLLRAQNPVGFTVLIPLFGTFAFAVLRLLPPIAEFGTLRMQIMSALPNAELTYTALQKEFNTIVDGTKELKAFNHNIRFDKVSFTHKGRSKTIKDISITLDKGDTTAIVGSSGGGKTTIVN